ncbi:uncharacterized protein BO97DRAFT_477363 [Aspergillus homomorphus CBS 101889]|uniref:Uncharacterized protein n=1 Tax=Aspergillus homomorphus (strain CBS 101889) TaxID=1450537 RepID=A0A395I010_ASPHC|nr:hypothetical protein BO97DRAFT_477363 [Aspergillus homomorphus CBS 101889]RAL13075.1 hypothetical protein BO97DRAFT_477363 [Aspergillus homomorphus CBS 101889]
MSGWPAPWFEDASFADTLAKCASPCLDIGIYAMAHPEEKVSAAYVAAFAVWATSAIKAAFALGAEAEFEQNRSQEASEPTHPTGDASGESTLRQEEEEKEEEEAEENKEVDVSLIEPEMQEGMAATRPVDVEEFAAASSVTSGYQGTGRCDDQVFSYPGRDSTSNIDPHTQDLRVYSPEDLKLRILSNVPLYTHLRDHDIPETVEAALRCTPQPEVTSVRIRQARRIGSKKMDLYFHSISDRECLLRYAEKWLPYAEVQQTHREAKFNLQELPPFVESRRNRAGETARRNGHYAGLSTRSSMSKSDRYHPYE